MSYTEKNLRVERSTFTLNNLVLLYTFHVNKLTWKLGTNCQFRVQDDSYIEHKQLHI
jgi:hypothetical protein